VLDRTVLLTEDGQIDWVYYRSSLTRPGQKQWIDVAIARSRNAARPVTRRDSGGDAGGLVALGALRRPASCSPAAHLEQAVLAALLDVPAAHGSDQNKVPGSGGWDWPRESLN
jgi:hypothetical protein